MEDRQAGGEHNQYPVSRPDPQLLQEPGYPLSVVAHRAEPNRLTRVEVAEQIPPGLVRPALRLVADNVPDRLRCPDSGHGRRIDGIRMQG
jgi:hypothetical protein